MPVPTLLVPFALPPAEHAKDLLTTLQMPALATLLARAAGEDTDRQPAFARLLPHERWLAGTSEDHSPPVARLLMQALQAGGTDDEGHWFVLQPVHFHIARDHLVLTDPASLDLDERTSRALFEACRSLFSEDGRTLVYGDPRHWFLRADDWAALLTSTPAAASGHNIDIWLPRGEGERAWRRLHNEVQMLWHAHPVNETREASGMARVNALWLWGGGSARDPGLRRYAEWLLGRITGPTGAARLAGESDSLVIDQSLSAAALAGDWGRWQAGLQAMEAQRFRPLLDALRAGELPEAVLALSDSQRLRRWRVTRAGMRKFWRTPSLAALARVD